MKWVDMSSDREVPSLETPVLVFDSPASEFARTMFGENRKRKLDEVTEYTVAEAPMIGASSMAAEALMSSKSGRLNEARHISRKKKDKKELLSLQIQRAVIADEDGDRAIHIAVAQENISLVQHLCMLMKRARVSLDVANHLKQTPLHVAVLVGNHEIVDILLRNGASVNLRDKGGNTPLQLTIKYFNFGTERGQKILNSLVSHPDSKFGFDYTDYQGLTAIHDAVSRRNVIAIEALCQAGADINVADGKSGRTCLACAVLAGDLQVVELLLQYGACAERQDYGGLSSLDFALHTGNKTLIRILEKFNKPSAKYSSFSECVSRPSQEEFRKNKETRKKVSKAPEKTKRKPSIGI